MGTGSCRAQPGISKATVMGSWGGSSAQHREGRGGQDPLGMCGGDPTGISTSCSGVWGRDPSGDQLAIHGEKGLGSHRDKGLGSCGAKGLGSRGDLGWDPSGSGDLGWDPSGTQAHHLGRVRTRSVIQPRPPTLGRGPRVPPRPPAFPHIPPSPPSPPQPYPRPSILQTCWMKGLQSKVPGSPRAQRCSSSRFTAR